MRTVVFVGLISIATALGLEVSDGEVKILGVILGAVGTMDLWEFFHERFKD